MLFSSTRISGNGSGGGGGGNINGTIRANQVAFGTGPDTIAGDQGFNYKSSTNQVFIDYLGANASDELIITNNGLGALGFLNYGAGDQEIHFDVTFDGSNYIAQNPTLAAIIDQSGTLQFWTGKGQTVGMPTDGLFASRLEIGDTGTVTIADLAGFGAGVVAVDLSGTLSWAAGAPATLTIGDPITSSSPYANLFVDGAGNLGQSNILYDISGNSIFDFTDLTALLTWGDVSNAGNRTKLIMNDTTGSLTFMNSGSVFGLAVSEFDATADFGVLQSGHGLYVYGPTATTHIDSGGFMQFSVSNDTGIQEMGDLSAQYFSNIIEIDGPNRLMTMQDSGSAYLSLDINNHLYKFGDITGANNATRIIVNDGSALITLSSDSETLITDATGRDIFRALPLSRQLQMGDLAFFGNRSIVNIDDGTPGNLTTATFTYSVGATSRPIFANGDGDVSLGAWGTTNGDSVGLGIQQGSNVVYVGKYDGVSLGANLVVDGGQKSIKIQGGFTQNQQYAVATNGSTQTCADDRSVITLNPAGTIAGCTIVAPTAFDGRIFTVSTTQTITTVTWSGGTFVGAPTSLGGGAFASFIYSSGDSKWHRCG